VQGQRVRPHLRRGVVVGAVVDRARAALASHQVPQLVVEVRLLLGLELVDAVLQLERVYPQVVEGDQARGELAVEEVVR
jgi:hypothetical protein